MLSAILEQSLLFLPLALGIYVSYAVLRIPDLTTDGSFVLGAALFAISVHAGLSPALAMAAATGGGILAGISVSALQIRFQLNPLIAGILLVFILNTCTLKFMGRPNLSLFNQPSLFGEGSKLPFLIILALAHLGSVTYLLASRLGLLLHAFGNNPTLLHLSAKNSHVYRTIGLAISNGLVGFSGGLSAQANGYADINMGTGIILIALGTVIIGQQLHRLFFKRQPFSLFMQLLCCLLGTLIYFSIVNLLIALGFDPIYLRLMIGLCLIGFLAATKEKTMREGFA